MTSSLKAGDKVCYKDGRPMKGPRFEDVPYKVVDKVYQTDGDEMVEYVGGGFDQARHLKVFETPFKQGDKVCYKEGFEDDASFPLYAVVEECVWERGKFIVRYTGGGWDYAGDLMIFKKPVEDTSKYHKHHDLIIAWAKGALIEYEGPTGNWYPIDKPSWSSTTNYRIASTEARQALELRREIEKLQKELAKLEGDL